MKDKKEAVETTAYVSPIELANVEEVEAFIESVHVKVEELRALLRTAPSLQFRVGPVQRSKNG